MAKIIVETGTITLIIELIRNKIETSITERLTQRSIINE
jgi:hypothetical protein